jgi:type IV secretory pathway VirB2 component (pilin)
MKKKRLAAFLPLLTLAAVNAAAQVLPSGMTNLMESVLEVFTGPFVKTILVLCLCGCAVAYGFNKDNEKMKRNIIAIGVAVALLVCAEFIVGAIWEASQS